MLALTLQAAIGLIWLAFWAMTTTIAVCFFAWAIRKGQFRNQRHAARLPLEAGDLEAGPDGQDEEGKE